MNLLQIISLVAFVLFLLAFVGLVILNVKLQIKNKKISQIALDLAMDNEFLHNHIQELKQQQQELNTESQEGFVKFLSTSRDWAFQYIEDTQAALLKFDELVSPRFEWARTYGTVNGKTVHGEIIDDIFLAYQELKKVLPENTETPNN